MLTNSDTNLTPSLNLNVVPPLCTGEISFTQISPKITEVVIAPLEKGYGLTLGNALRRILLSSLPGCAITSVKIAGVLHEYSTIPGVKEDMMEIILNLKKVAASVLQDQEKAHVKINPKGPIVLTAGAFNTKEVKICNPDQIICHIAEGYELNIDITFSNGRGFKRLKEISQESNYDIGEIFIDCVFNPVKLISIKVEDMRVGQKIGYDKLTLNIETNGMISVKQAIDFAAKTLRKQLSSCIFYNDDELIIDSKAQQPTIDPVLLKKVTTLDLSVRSINCMKNINIVYIGDLVTKSEMEILKTPNFGRKSLNEIKAQLRDLGLTLNMTVSDWPPKQLQEKHS